MKNTIIVVEYSDKKKEVEIMIPLWMYRLAMLWSALKFYCLEKILGTSMGMGKAFLYIALKAKKKQS